MVWGRKEITLAVVVGLLIIFILYKVFSKKEECVCKPCIIPTPAPPKNSITGRYITVSKKSGYLEVRQIEAFDLNGTLIPPVNASGSASIVDPKSLPINTVINRSFPLDGCFITGGPNIGADGSRFLTIDYGKNVGISKINIHLRNGCCHNMMVGAVVKIKDSSSNIVFTSYPFPSVDDPYSTTTQEMTALYEDPFSNKAPNSMYTISIPDKLPSMYPKTVRQRLEELCPISVSEKRDNVVYISKGNGEKRDNYLFSACTAEGTCNSITNIDPISKHLLSTIVPGSHDKMEAKPDAPVCGNWVVGDYSWNPTTKKWNPSKIALKGGRNNKYCTDEADKIICNRDGIADWEKFTVETLPNNQIALKGRDGTKYCGVEDSTNLLKCNKNTRDLSEKFTVYTLDNNKIALRSVNNGKYCTDEGDKIICNRDTIGDWEKFTTESVS